MRPPKKTFPEEEHQLLAIHKPKHPVFFFVGGVQYQVRYSCSNLPFYLSSQVDFHRETQHLVILHGVSVLLAA